MNKRYLGDGVYVEYNPHIGILTLTTEDGIRITNTIVLEGEVYLALTKFVGDVLVASRTKTPERETPRG